MARHRLLRRRLLRLLPWLPWAVAGFSLPAAAQELEGGMASQVCRSMGPAAVLGICAITLIGTFVGLLSVGRRLRREGWSLANALSEPTRLTIPLDSRWSQSQGDREAEQATPAGIGLIGAQPGQQGSPMALTILEASSSRLIALLGSIALLLIYLGFGIVALYSFGLTCQMPASTSAVTSFLYAGLTLFAPYVANKVSGILKPVLAPVPAAPPERAGTRLPSQSDDPAAMASRREAAPPGSAGEASRILDRVSLAEPAAAAPLAPHSPASAPAAASTAAQSPVGGAPQRPGPAEAAPATAAPQAGAMPSRRPAPAASASAPALASIAPAPVYAPAPVSATAPAAVRTPAAAPSGSPYGAAVELIARFEGFVDHAYPDPASGGEPWTIGYGFTSLKGRPVQPGDTISQQAATVQLGEGVEACATHLGGTIPHWDAMATDQRCALISFAWNLGQDFYGSAGFDTISERLRDRNWEAVPAALELYCDPGSAVCAGLLRRRQAEGALWRQGMASQAAAGPAEPAAARAATGATHPNPLQVPWFDQLAMDDGQGWRDCFSASSAMLAAYWGKEPNEDDYNTLRQCYGDSTSAEAQLAALRHLGLQADFRTDGTLETLKAEIDAGRPVAVGWLHHGPPSAPSGGGHWTVVIGYDADGVVMNDPYGSCDLVHGGYPQNHNGARQHYSYRNWLPRWQPQGSGGWYLSCRP